MFYKRILLLFISFLFLVHIKSHAAIEPYDLTHFSINNANHAVYVGVIQLTHLPNRPTAEIIVKIFQNDLQDVLRHAFGLKKIAQDIDFFKTQNSEIQQYFQAHLKCHINQQATNLIFKNGTAENDVYCLNFEINCPEKWETANISADFFMELFPTQSNVIQLQHEGIKRFGRLKKEATTQIFKF